MNVFYDKFFSRTASKRKSIEDDEDGEDGEDGDSNKAKKLKHEWNELITLASNQRVSEWIKEHPIKYVSTTKANFGDTDWYRCGLLKRKYHWQCPVKVKIVKQNDRQDFAVWFTTWDHHHPDKKGLIMPEKYREEIARQTVSKARPNQILRSLNDRFANEYPMDIRQVRYQKGKVAPSESIINQGELVNWFRSKKLIPNDIDEPFCLSFSHHAKNGAFNAVFSTIRLLSFAQNPHWSADSTYKLVWQNYPINIVGAFDAAGKFHMLAISISTNETSDDWFFIFTAIAIGAKKHHKFDVRPTHVMTDAAMAIKNGFLKAFPYLEGTDFDLMCGFHMKKALLGAQYLKKENKARIKNDVDILEQCSNKEVFEHVLELFLSKWRTHESAFVEYFVKEWVKKNPNWFAAANLKVPNTNNAIEGFNSTLKRDHTLRERQPMTQFAKTFIDMIRYKSEMYTREIERKVFNIFPIIKDDDLKKGAAFASQKDVRSKIVLISDDTLCVISKIECADPKNNIKSANDVAKFKEKILLANSFDEYVENMHQRIYQVYYADDWRESTCTCSFYMKKLMCKHIIAIAFIVNDIDCPVGCNPNVLQKKKSRGRPAKAKKALNMQNDLK